VALVKIDRSRVYLYLNLYCPRNALHWEADLYSTAAAVAAGVN